jgi:hypothetical protein
VALAGGDSAVLRVVDVRRLRRVGVLYLGSGRIVAGIWVAPDRLVAVKANETSEVLVVDPRTVRVSRRASLGGPVVAATTAGDRIVALAAEAEGIGALRLAVVDANGTSRSVPLPSVSGGSTFDEQTGVGQQASPGLAVDPSGSRAVVVADGGTVAEVDLATLAVSLHQTLARTTAAAAKLITGWGRNAVWASPSLIAVTGWTLRPAPGTAEPSEEWAPIGLSFLDTRTWTARQVDAGTASAALDRETLLGYGRGLSVFSLDGSLRFHLFGDEPITDVQAAQGLAYVGGCDRRCFRIVDPSTGRLLGRARTAVSTSLLG